MDNCNNGYPVKNVRKITILIYIVAVNKITLAQTFSAGGGGMSGRRNVCQVRVGRFEIIAA